MATDAKVISALHDALMSCNQLCEYARNNPAAEVSARVHIIEKLISDALSMLADANDSDNQTADRDSKGVSIQVTITT